MKNSDTFKMKMTKQESKSRDQWHNFYRDIANLIQTDVDALDHRRAVEEAEMTQRHAALIEAYENLDSQL